MDGVLDVLNIFNGLLDEAKLQVFAVSIRFYAELNDFLPPARRQKRFVYRCAQEATIKNTIENLGVPHTEAELVLVNGEAVDLSRRARDGDEITVYPAFVSLGPAAAHLRKGRPEFAGKPRFIADAHLGGLARFLRMLGFDTLYRDTLADREIAELAASEQRIVLTRDRDLLMHRAIIHGYFVRDERPRAQLCDVIRRFDLALRAPLSRCLRCNCRLTPIGKDAVRDRLPARTALYYDEFWTCTGCARIYWKGSHWQRMSRFASESVAANRAETAPCRSH